VAAKVYGAVGQSAGNYLITDTAANLAGANASLVGFSGGAFFSQIMRYYGEDFTAYAIFQGGLDVEPFGFLQDDVGSFLTVDADARSTLHKPQLVVHQQGDGAVLPAQGLFTANLWAETNGCQPLADATTDAISNDDCVEYAGCDDGAGLVLCRPAGGEHSVWSPEGGQVLRAFFARLF
jgi:poly(3-hydroxybutyrate) depolymerase